VRKGTEHKEWSGGGGGEVCARIKRFDRYREKRMNVKLGIAKEGNGEINHKPQQVIITAER
jgi:hypothetical protein